MRALPDRIDLALPAMYCHQGGKSKLSKKIVPLIPPHKIYLEPFMGGASVFFRKPLAKVNVLSDLDRMLVKGHRVDCGKLERLYAKHRRAILSEGPSRLKLFESLRKKFYNGTITPEEYWILKNVLSYGCAVSLQKTSHAFNSHTKLRKLGLCRAQVGKLKMAKVLNKDFRSVLRRYNRPDAFAYLDPPYYKVKNDYDYHRVHPREVCGALRNFKGKFLLSYNDHPEVRSACVGFFVKSIPTVYSYGCDPSRAHYCNRHKRELLISNYRIPGSKVLGRKSR